MTGASTDTLYIIPFGAAYVLDSGMSDSSNSESDYSDRSGTGSFVEKKGDEIADEFGIEDDSDADHSDGSEEENSSDSSPSSASPSPAEAKPNLTVHPGVSFSTLSNGTSSIEDSSRGDLEAKLAREIEQVAMLTERCSKQQLELQRVGKENSMLSHSVKVAARSIENFTEKLQEGHVRNEEVSKQACDIEEKNNELREKIKSMSKGHDEKVRGLEEDLKELTLRLEDSTSRAKRIRTESTEETNKLKVDLDHIMRQLETRNRAVEKMKVEVNEANSEKNSVKENLESLSAEAQERIGSLEAEVKKLTDVVDEQRLEMALTRKRESALEGERARVQELLRQHAKLNSEHRRSISDQAMAIEQHKSISDSRLDAIRALNVELEQAGKDVLESERNRKAIGQRNVSLVKDFSDMREKYAVVKEEAATMRLSLEREKMSKKDLVNKLKHLQKRRAREYNENASRIVALENFCETVADEGHGNAAPHHSEVKFEEKKQQKEADPKKALADHLARERGVDAVGVKRLLAATTRELRFKANALAELSEKFVAARGTAQEHERELASLRAQVESLDDANKVLSVENQICVELLYKANGMASINQG